MPYDPGSIKALRIRRGALTHGARALGQRAVCLANSLGDQGTVDALLHQLSMHYGRRGFVVPPPRSCAADFHRWPTLTKGHDSCDERGHDRP